MRRALLALLFAAALPAQRVWVVAPVAGTGVDFTAIQDAVNAAVDGDMIVVRAGSYASVSISQKALTLVADGAVYGFALEIRDVLATQSVAIHGLTMTSSTTTPLVILNCLGPVTLRQCSFSLFAPFSTFYVGGSVGGSTQVTLVDCTFSSFAGFRGTVPGLMGFASTMHMHRCVVSGGSATAGQQFPGAVGMQLGSTFLHASQCTFRGGNGAAGMNLGGFCLPPTDGGHAVYFTDLSSSLYHLGCQFVPGQPGPPGQGCPPGNAGQPIAGSANVVAMSGPARSFEAAALVRAGQSVRFDFAGPVGALVWLGLSARQSPFFLPACGGTFHLDLATMTPVLLGSMPASGQLTVNVPAPAQLGVQGIVVFSQAVFIDLSGACLLAMPGFTLLIG